MSTIILSASSGGLRILLGATTWVHHVMGIIGKTINLVLNATRWMGNAGKTTLYSVYIYGTRSNECPY